MAGKIRVFLRLTVRPSEDEEQTQLGLPPPLACLIVSLIWFWVRVHLGMPADTPLFHNRFWIFGDGLFMALGIGGIVFTVLWIKDIVKSFFEKIL